MWESCNFFQRKGSLISWFWAPEHWWGKYPWHDLEIFGYLVSPSIVIRNFDPQLFNSVGNAWKIDCDWWSNFLSNSGVYVCIVFNFVISISFKVGSHDWQKSGNLHSNCKCDANVPIIYITIVDKADPDWSDFHIFAKRPDPILQSGFETIPCNRGWMRGRKYQYGSAGSWERFFYSYLIHLWYLISSKHFRDRSCEKHFSIYEKPLKLWKSDSAS